MDFKHLTTVGAALVLGTALSGNLQATMLAPGTTLTKPPLAGSNYTSGSPVAIGGVLYPGVVVSPNVNSPNHLNSPMVGAFKGDVDSWVYGDDATAPTELLFVYQFSMAQTGADVGPDLIRATIGELSNPWEGFVIIDAGSDGNGVSTGGGGPPAASWANGDPNFLLRDPPGQEGLTIQWRAQSVGTVLNDANMSAKIWFLVEAENWTTTNVGLLDSGSVGTSTAFAPAPPNGIPEPTTLALLGLGLAGIGVVRRRRKIS